MVGVFFPTEHSSGSWLTDTVRTEHWVVIMAGSLPVLQPLIRYSLENASIYYSQRKSKWGQNLETSGNAASKAFQLVSIKPADQTRHVQRGSFEGSRELINPTNPNEIAVQTDISVVPETRQKGDEV